MHGADDESDDRCFEDLPVGRFLYPTALSSLFVELDDTGPLAERPHTPEVSGRLQHNSNVELVRGPGSADGLLDSVPANGQASPGDGAQLPGLANQARGYYDRALEAQRNGDWAAYGEELRLLGEVLARMRPQ